MQLFFRLLFLASLFVLGGCATPRPPNAQSFQEISASRPGFATLYIYRSHHEISRAVWPEMFINEQKVVDLKNEGYTVLFVRTGKYRIRTEKNSFMSGMDNIPGEFEIRQEGTYYLKFDRSYNQFMSQSGTYASPSFTRNYERWTLVSREIALPEISKCYFIQPDVDAISL